MKFITGQGGQEVKRIEYDVFRGIYKGASPYGLETGYTGKPYDSVTGLSDYGFRDYSPTHARFITEDPIRDGENWFAYVGNNPVNWVDPWGLSASDGKKNKEPAQPSQNTLSFSRGIGAKLALIFGVGVEAGIIVDKNLNVYFYTSGSVGTGIQTPAVKTPLSTKNYLLSAKGQSTGISLDPNKIGFSSSTTVDIGLGVIGTYDLDNLNKSGAPNSYGYGSVGGGVWKNGTVVFPLYKGEN